MRVSAMPRTKRTGATWGAQHLQVCPDAEYFDFEPLARFSACLLFRYEKARELSRRFLLAARYGFPRRRLQYIRLEPHCNRYAIRMACVTQA